jgi:hypothetical protein
MRRALPITLTEQSTGIQRFGYQVIFALYLAPFAALAFLWFLGVLRSRMAPVEDLS